MTISSDFPTLLTICAVLALLPLTSMYLLRRRQSKLPLPPGPPKLPLVGNLFNYPSTFEWETYMEWSRMYDSDILHLGVAGRSIVVLSSKDAAMDLLEKRSAIYSDRSVLMNIGLVLDLTWNRPRLPMSNSIWMAAMQKRAHRRLFHGVFHEQAAKKFLPAQLSATHQLLRRMLHTPEDFVAHLRHMAGRLIMETAYGIDVLPQNDPYVNLAEKALHSLAYALVPGRFIVDSLPVLKYIPMWFPGAGFQRLAKEWKNFANEMIEKPYAEAKLKIASGNAPHSFTASALQSLEDSNDKEYRERVIKGTAGTMYTAASDTTVAALNTFILAMLANPEAQKKAQAEIDSVVKRGHLPDFDDEASLPYVTAVFMEVLRWQPVTPIGMPHCVSVEDEYRGYRIPANSTVIANIWAILHDEIVYPDPYIFNPERFLLDGKLNSSVQWPDAAFGFGRRICPGRHMAKSSIWIGIASILAAFDITKEVGQDGQVVEPSYEYFAAMVLMPLPFQCSIRPRSKEAEALIRATADQE
ncbi:cytochrome P450 [Roridomyces roridus]|uniref:Cytochrome P450 n=1 Tax=Roridomyces roridus TaxID=1738132 RepID=A0AAD7FA09_9AGAR|nr:cytochrome P450 [Roridomyces roridus]